MQGDEPYYGSAASEVPPGGGLDAVAEAAKRCRACHLWRLGTQTVFGEGPENARLFLVGEQPGDKEDIEGRPFVGPAGRLLDELLQEAGIARDQVYLTNAVKHFKWVAGGGRRLHGKPNRKEVVACHPWLQTEIALVAPRLVVCLGATAAQALLGPAFKLTQNLGQIIEAGGVTYVATLHPSAVLRMPDRDARQAARAQILQDLATAAGWAAR